MGERAVALGMISVADLKADTVACTPTGFAKSPLPVPEAGRARNASQGALARFTIEVPETLITKLIFVDCQLQHSERGDVVAILAALSRSGREPTITDTAEHLKVLSF
jgi:hypothetical protein